MNASQFEQALSQLTEQDFQAILDGQALIVDQDQALKIGRPDAAFVIYELGEDAIDSVEALKAHLVENAEALIAEYYQFNPISREQFQRHIQRLFAEHGPQAFVGLNGQLPERVIFAENGELVCEDASSPRFKYGIYLQLEEAMNDTVKANKAKNWLMSGTAYGDYISINVCRFSSM